MPDPAPPALIRSGLLLGVAHGFSERAGGVSPTPFASLNLGPRTGDDAVHVRENRRRVLATAGLAGSPVLAPRQTHSADVATYRPGDAIPRGQVFDGDGLITDARGPALMVLAADCVPVLLWDPARQVIAAVHAGWRGTAGGIAARAVRVMGEVFGCRAEDIRAALGPAIHRCCYEVGPEVVAAVAAVTPLAPHALADGKRDGKAMMDLPAANAAQLAGTGVPAAQIDTLPHCTACQVDRFFSHRRERGRTGRAGAVIALR